MIRILFCYFIYSLKSETNKLAWCKLSSDLQTDKRKLKPQEPSTSQRRARRCFPCDNTLLFTYSDVHYLSNIYLLIQTRFVEYHYVQFIVRCATGKQIRVSSKNLVNSYFLSALPVGKNNCWKSYLHYLYTRVFKQIRHRKHLYVKHIYYR